MVGLGLSIPDPFLPSRFLVLIISDKTLLSCKIEFRFWEFAHRHPRESLFCFWNVMFLHTRSYSLVLLSHRPLKPIICKTKLISHPGGSSLVKDIIFTQPWRLQTWVFSINPSTDWYFRSFYFLNISPVYPWATPLSPPLPPAQEGKHFPFFWKQNASWLTVSGVRAGEATDANKGPMLSRMETHTVQINVRDKCPRRGQFRSLWLWLIFFFKNGGSEFWVY